MEKIDKLTPLDTDDSMEYVTGEDITYSTGEVAKMLNIERDTLRYNIKPFIDDYISIERTSSKESAHWRIHSKDIELISTIIRLRKQGKSVTDIKEMLDEPGISLLLGQGTVATKAMIETMAEILTKNNELLFAKFSESFEKLQSSKHDSEVKYIEDSEKLRKQNEYLKSQVDNLSQKLDELTTLIDKRIPEKKRFGIFGKK